MKEELEKLDFVYDVYQFKWDRIILPALREFYRVHGHADVPKDFVVPIGDEAWPKLAWGYHVGHVVSKIRHREAYSTLVAMSKEELDRMGFCYDMSIPERDWTEKTLPSIRVYRQVFGDCIIPTLFIVPSLPPWPEKAWGMALGAACGMKSFFRHLKLTSTSTRIAIPYRFVVPSEDPWPKKSWGKRLGDALSRMRNRGTYFEQYGRDIEKLDELGLNLKLLSTAWNRRVIPLLDTYAELHGEGEVPLGFVIPSEAPWEKKAWGVVWGSS
ncbi:hypothetical protein PF005_g8463 [Phytophthora fragariae]|nr:hypothetical protein PF007_g4539 [Phytophthora fragariae]KAE9217942.1 hypothetical protein PF005_g8463 [Phytophthora fragariae]KAE9240500.1 hypothetical protein PF004_g7472 [Phytophthora fragariae]KAE9323383.1 hypothetical protein PF001_g3955 [Phytophthora fragariae]